jgi:hypothetical protein
MGGLSQIIYQAAQRLEADSQPQTTYMQLTQGKRAILG